MKAGKSAIRPWLSCQYNENTLVDRPSSVIDFHIFQEILMNFMALKSLIQRQSLRFSLSFFPNSQLERAVGCQLNILKEGRKIVESFDSATAFFGMKQIQV